MEASPTRPLRPGLTPRLAAGGGAAFAAALLWFHPAHAALHHAALVIQHSSGRILTKCVGFAEAQISGFQMIERSGVTYQAQTFGSMGSAVCQLDGEPSSVPSNCFGYGPSWQYFHWQGGWRPSLMGASSSTLHDGDMDGWRYAAGANQGPDNVSFAAVCSAPPPSVAATDTPRPTTTAPTAPNGATPVPTPAPAPTTSLEALAASPSPKPDAVLTSTGPPTQPPKATAIGPWLAFGSMVVLLLTLGAINLRRRGP